jgi:hypothetical protein
MKRTLLLLLSLIMLLGFAAVMPAAADESEYYYVNVPIIKIFPHQLGYYVIYRRAGLKTGELFIPKEWFDRRDQRAVMNTVRGKVTPYLSVMMKNGEFDHVQVMVSENIDHYTWGVLTSGSVYNDKFKVDKLTLEY